MIMMKIDPEINDINDIVYKAEQAEKSCDKRIVERNCQTEDDNVEQAVVYSTLPQEYSTLTFGERCCWVVVEWKRGAK